VLEILFACLGVLIFACILLAVHISHLEKQVNDNVRLLKAVESLADGISARLENMSLEVSALKRDLEGKDAAFQDDLRCLDKRVHAATERMSTLEEKVSDAYETVEAQAKKEKLLFDGINSIMDYDIGVARKAVGGDAGE